MVTQFYGLRNRMPIAFSITLQLQTAFVVYKCRPSNL